MRLRALPAGAVRRSSRDLAPAPARLRARASNSHPAIPASAWGRDACAIYFAANVVEGIDVTSFEVLDWNEARDRQNVFYGGERYRRPQDQPRKAHLARLKER